MRRHNDFPFSPFFQVLAESGIKITLADYGRLSTVLRSEGVWDIAKLRIVIEALLTKNPEESKRFRKCFDSFFATELSEYSEEKLQSNPELTPDRRTNGPGIKRRGYLKYVDYAVLVIALVGTVALAYDLLRSRDNGSPQITANSNVSFGPSPGNSPNATPTPTATPVKLLFFADVRRMLRVLATLITVLGIGYSLVRLFRSSRRPTPGGTSNVLAQPSESDGPRVFSLRAIGGEQLRLLSENALDQIASSIRYAMNEQPTARLDIGSSVAATGRRGGLLSLVYQRSQTVRKVNIIVDAYAEPLKWNHLPEELAAGLLRRGVSVASGKFFGRPDRFTMEDGDSVWLEDLEDTRNSLMLLIFSDGKQLDYRRDKSTLESLRRFRTAAWFDLREPQFWDESAWLITHHRVPLFQAIESGILEAMNYFLTEYNRQRTASRHADRVWRGAPAFASGDVDSYLERLLGDALPWAQCCSMLQPLPLNFANTLREKFQPQLPPERIERLFRIPGTWFDASGLLFSQATLASLRSGFSVRWDDSEQFAMLRFIISAIESAEPPEKDSLKHLAWEWTLERVRLEVEPDEALRRITRLSDTPLGPHIRSEMAYLLSSHQETGRADYTGVPLRARPQTKRGEQLVTHFKRVATIRPAGVVRDPKSARLIAFKHNLEWLLENFFVSRMAIGFARGIVEYAASMFDFLAYFPHPPGHRKILGHEDQPGFRYFQKWFS